MTHTDTTILHLTLCDGIGPAFIGRTLAACDGDLQKIYTWSAADWIQRLGLSAQRANQLVEHLSKHELLHDELALIDRVDARWITIADLRYPALLHAIHAPPSVLYWRGSYDLLAHPQALAIIGSRNADTYGARIIKT